MLIRMQEKRRVMCTMPLYIEIYNSFNHNSTKLETTQMVFSRWMVKHTVIPILE